MGGLLAINAQLRAVIAAQQAEIHALMEAVPKLTDRVAELVVMVEKKKRSATRTPKPPAAAPEVAEAERVAFDDRPRPPAPSAPEKATTKVSPTGRKPLPKHLPVDEATVTPTHCCRCHSTALTVVDEVVKEKLDVRAHHRRRVTHRRTCR